MTEKIIEIINSKIDIFLKPGLADLGFDTSNLITNLKPEDLKKIDSTLKDFTSIVGKSINNLSEKIVQTVKIVILESNIQLSQDLSAKIHDLVGSKLYFEIFEKRFKIFIESIDRHYQRMGIVPQWGNYRLDLSSTKYEAFIKTILRKNLIQLNSELELIRLLKEPKDVQEDFLNNAVDLKPNFFGLGLNVNYIISKIKESMQKKRST